MAAGVGALCACIYKSDAERVSSRLYALGLLCDRGLCHLLLWQRLLQLQSVLEEYVRQLHSCVRARHCGVVGARYNLGVFVRRIK